MVPVEEDSRPKCRNRRVMSLDDLADADIEALETTRAPESAKAFDDELTPKQAVLTRQIPSGNPLPWPGRHR